MSDASELWTAVDDYFASCYVGADDAAQHALQHALQHVAAEPRVSATGLQTVGVKGYDWLAILLVQHPEGHT